MRKYYISNLGGKKASGREIGNVTNKRDEREGKAAIPPQIQIHINSSEIP